MTCVICRNDSSNQYQCCSNNEHKFCESCCLNIISSISEKGKIVSLINGKVPCYVCNKKLKCERFPESVHIILNHILSTVPKTSKKPKSIQDFNYYYNQFDQLRHCITNKKFVFLTQRHYELLGKCIEIYIQSLIKNDQWNYEEIWLPIENHYQNYVNIFISDDFKINENGCLILIQGSGVVRAGQWSRYCCINESLDIGAMFPYMLKAKEYNLSVIILNPNQTTYSNEEEGDDDFSEDIRSFYLSPDPLPPSSMKPIPGLSTSYEHILYVYDKIIIKQSPAKKFYVVAHSAGGDNLMHLLRKRQDSILPKLSKIAFIDSIHTLTLSDANGIKSFLKCNAVHMIANEKPMGEPIHFSQKPICPEISAGHLKHEYTPRYCIKYVFDFFFS